MCAESIVIDEIIKANIGEKCGSAFGGLYVNAGIFEISCASSDGNGAVHDHGSKAFAQSKGHTIAIAIAMGHVPVGFGCFVASTGVLNGQELFLSILTNVKSRHVIDIMEHMLRQRGSDGVAPRKTLLYYLSFLTDFRSSPPVSYFRNL